MARYFAIQPGKAQPIAIDLEPLEGGRFQVVVNDRRYEVDALMLGNERASLLIDGHSYTVEFEKAGEWMSVQVKNQITRLEMVDERQLGLRDAQAKVSPSGPQVVTAPMPGKIVRVLTRMGEQVDAGQGLVVIEAMKMENELKSPKAGKVIALFAEPGAAVENNAKLVVID